MTHITRSGIALAAVLAPLIASQAAHANEPSQSAEQITLKTQQVACQGYSESLVNVLRTTAYNLSREGMQANNQAPLNRTEQQSTIREILQGIIASETDTKSRQIITRAANSYLRSGRVESFERGLEGLTQACMSAKTNPQSQHSTPNEAKQAPAPAPAPQKQWRYRNDTQQKPEQKEKPKSRLPAQESYL